jgi:hypothetical protein
VQSVERNTDRAAKRGHAACRGRRADHAQKDRVGTWEIPRSARAIPLLVRIGKGEPKADDERTREVGPSSSSYEAGEQGGAIRRGDGGAKGWDQGECEPAAHGPDAELGNRVTAAGAHTSNRKAICRHSPEVGAVCGKAARTDLCGGRGAISVPTATDLPVAQSGSASWGTSDVPLMLSAQPFVTNLERRLCTAALRWVGPRISLRSVRGDNEREGNGYGSQESAPLPTLPGRVEDGRGA